MAGLLQATAIEPTDDGLVATLDPAWNIWGPAGGYLAAIALAAVRTEAPPGHRPVSLTGQFVRVAKPGRLDVAVTSLRTGTTALFAVVLAQDGQPVFVAQVWSTARADAALPLAPTMPDVPPPNDCAGRTS